MRLYAHAGQSGRATPWAKAVLYNGSRQRDPRDNPMEIADNPWPAIGKASLSEAQVIALWEAITNTLRPRPNGF